MKAGVLQFFSWPERRVPLQTVYARAFERIDLMDRSGYDAVWLAEHHFNTYSVCPSVHMMATHVAARTQNLRVGTAVSLAPFYHPLRLAEDIALLDVLSGGRVNWGAGRGFDPTEFGAFGVDVAQSAERLHEAVEIVLRAWTEERVTFDGRFHRFRDVEVLPKPVQSPHPPVWLATTSPDSIRRAATRGYSILMDPHSTHAELAAKRELYRAELEAHGHSIAGRDIPMARLLAVADTASEAEEIARRGAAWTVASYANPASLAPHLKQSGIRPAADPVQRYLDGVAVHGTPDAVLDQLEQLQDEMGLGYLLCAPLSHGSFVQFTEKVLPRLR